MESHDDAVDPVVPPPRVPGLWDARRLRRALVAVAAGVGVVALFVWALRQVQPEPILPGRIWVGVVTAQDGAGEYLYAQAFPYSEWRSKFRTSPHVAVARSAGAELNSVDAYFGFLRWRRGLSPWLDEHLGPTLRELGVWTHPLYPLSARYVRTGGSDGFDIEYRLAEE